MKVFEVGGCVRDELMGVQPVDRAASGGPSARPTWTLKKPKDLKKT